MKHTLIFLAVIIWLSIITTSCKKSEEIKIKGAEEAQTDVSGKGGLARAMKKASIAMRRLARAVEKNNWVEIDMWTEELKEGIGFNCVELYMIENNDISYEFNELSSKFNSAVDKLILSGKEENRDNAKSGFDSLVDSCKACHEIFNKDAKAKLDFTDSGQR